MKRAQFCHFDCLAYDLGRGVHDFSDAELHLALSAKEPDEEEDEGLADIREIAPSSGYEHGGLPLDTAWGQKDAKAGLTAEAATIRAEGGTIGPFRYAVVFNASAPKKALIGYIDCGKDVRLDDGETYTFTFGGDLLAIDLGRDEETE